MGIHSECCKFWDAGLVDYLFLLNTIIVWVSSSSAVIGHQPMRAKWAEALSRAQTTVWWKEFPEAAPERHKDCYAYGWEKLIGHNPVPNYHMGMRKGGPPVCSKFRRLSGHGSDLNSSVLQHNCVSNITERIRTGYKYKNQIFFWLILSSAVSGYAFFILFKINLLIL